jgi:hypothetical protein
MKCEAVEKLIRVVESVEISLTLQEARELHKILRSASTLYALYLDLDEIINKYPPE